ncbi:hypothetical protein [Methanoregula sp. UBA64]|jgi:hypothetical protein|uniref:hypothetical protein n=1 Tax=Methanoregula sp. UBA64 TaxID=1915554 RepID=UPI0025CB9C05|nr:hypothetical protein [Methanoregula sp. UBA64]
MSAHEYTPENALSLLMQKLKERNQDLALKIQSEIDSGKDIRAEEPEIDKRKNPHTYRKKVPYSHAEALQIAVDALESYFIEQPLFVKSMTENLGSTLLGGPNLISLDRSYEKNIRDKNSFVSAEKRKPVEIELRTETQMSIRGEETIELIPPSFELIESQKKNLEVLRYLTNFKEG